jgi:hypothetical protein
MLAAVVVPAVALLIGVGSVADSDASATPVWPGKPVCAQGAITAAERTAATPARTPLAFSIRPCAGITAEKQEAARWGLALYYTGSNLLGPRAYIDESAIHGFAADGDTTGRITGYVDGDLTVGVLGEIQAACLVTGLSARVACARIDDVGATGTIVVEPLAVDDPMVTRTVEVLALRFPDPVCAACVRSTPPTPSTIPSATASIDT